MGFGQQGPGGPFADRQSARHLTDHRHFLRRIFVRRHGRGRHDLGNASVFGGRLDFYSSQPGFRAGHFSQGVQTRIGSAAQRIGITGVRGS